jgi:hypothetical protein
MIDFNNLKFDKSLLLNLQNINPYEIFGNLGISKQDTDEILKGNLDPAFKEEPFIIDYPTFFKNYGNYFNHNLISLFFNKAKEKIELSPEEWETYKEAYNNFFSLIFIVGKDGIFQVDLTGELKEECLLIQFENSYFILIKFSNHNKIFYLEKTSNS